MNKFQQGDAEMTFLYVCRHKRVAHKPPPPHAKATAEHAAAEAEAKEAAAAARAKEEKAAEEARAREEAKLEEAQKKVEAATAAAVAEAKEKAAAEKKATAARKGAAEKKAAAEKTAAASTSTVPVAYEHVETPEVETPKHVDRYLRTQGEKKAGAGAEAQAAVETPSHVDRAAATAAVVAAHALKTHGDDDKASLIAKVREAREAATPTILQRHVHPSPKA